MLRTMDLRIADHGKRAGREPAAQIASALFADAAELFFTPARVLLRYQPNPGREATPRAECLWISNARDQSGGQRRTTPGISSSRLLVSFDRCQAMIRRSN